MLNYKNDSLLLDRETANELMSKGKEDLLFLDQERGLLNLFSAFVKKADFIRKDKINQPLQKTVYVKVSSAVANIIRSRYSRKDLKKAIEYYIQRRSNCGTAIERWNKQHIFPLLALRITSKDSKELANFLLEADYFTDFLNKSRFYSPKKISEMLCQQLIYFVGCSVGDGNLDRNEKRWTLVDGSSDPEKLKGSEEFVSALASMLEKYVHSSEIRKNETKYELKVNNKVFCRFLNFFFGLPFGPKKNSVLQVPSMLCYSKDDLKKYFWRGLFDTDGHVGSEVSFCSSDKHLFQECEQYLQTIGIQPGFSERNLMIPASATKKFSTIGFSHPRKQSEFLTLLKKGATFKLALLKEGAKPKINPKLFNIYELLRVDKEGYRVRLNSVILRKKKMDVSTINQICRELFNLEFRRAANGLYYFKSKETYEYLNQFFTFEPAWNPITENEGACLQQSWNEVWLKC